jgi:hypothetical protein
MTYLTELLHNQILITAASAWVVAQVLKFIIHIIINHKVVWERLIGDGGMPSCHSCTVCAAATAVGIHCGLGSPEFAIITIVAIIVMHDATGVRLETGKQAVIINDMMDLLKSMGSSMKTSHEKLTEFVGHTPIQVAVGAILGLCYSLLINL